MASSGEDNGDRENPERPLLPSNPENPRADLQSMLGNYLNNFRRENEGQPPSNVAIGPRNPETGELVANNPSDLDQNQEAGVEGTPPARNEREALNNNLDPWLVQTVRRSETVLPFIMLQIVVVIVQNVRDIMIFITLTWWVYYLGSGTISTLNVLPEQPNIAVALAFMPLPEAPTEFYQLVWVIFLNDFMVRFATIAFKGLLATIDCDPSPPCHRGHGTVAGNRRTRHFMSCFGRRLSDISMSSAVFRRRRQIFALIEMISVQYRMMVSIIPWCQFYHLSQFSESGPLFTGVYMWFKLSAASSHLKSTWKLLRMYTTQEGHGQPVDEAGLVEAGETDCSICCERFVHPVRLSCSHVFCEDCVNEWLEREKTCPLCRVEVIFGDDATFREYLDGRTSMCPQLF